MTAPWAETRLWERSRRSAHAEIVDTAMRLFAAHGFAETTIDQIVAAAGISRRSFFRYFGTKEDVVLGDLAELGELVEKELVSRPQGESVWDALAAAIAAPAPRYSPERALLMARLFTENPSLKARHLEKHARWQAVLVPHIERRLGIQPGPIPDPGAHAIVGTVLTCLDTATEIWARGDGAADLAELYGRALSAVRG